MSVKEKSIKRLKPSRRLITVIILGLLLVFLLNPQWIPFLSDKQVAEVKTMLNNTFASSPDGAKLFSAPVIINILAVIAGVSVLSALLRFVIELIGKAGKRSETVAGLLTSIIKYASVIVIIVWCMSLAGVNTTGIFASLGVVSLVLGFGAQSLIEDIITGIFIIFEGQYNVGDVIILDDFRGIVRHIGVRTTIVEDLGGNLKIVNNSDIRNIQNRSRNLSSAVCDVGVPYDMRIEDVEKVLESALPAINAKYPELYKKPIEYAGVQELGASAVVIRVVGKVDESDIFRGVRTLNRELKIAFDDADVNIPFQQVVVHQPKKK